MNISYKDVFGVSISAGQTANETSYDKIHTPVGSQLIKKIEYYVDNEINTIDYYKDAGEANNEIINELLQYGCGFGIIEREPYGSYIIEIADHYGKGSFVGKTRTLCDGDGLHIAFEEIDPVTNLPDYELTNKYLGEYIHEEDSGCIFYYDSDGNFSYCEDNHASYQDKELFDETTLPQIKHRYLLSDAMYNYYLTAEFLPPV